MSYDSFTDDAQLVAVARQKTSVPGILLLVVGGINILIAFYLLQQGIRTAGQTVAEYEQELKQTEEQLPTEWKNSFQESRKEAAQQGWTTERMKETSVTATLTAAGVVSVAGLLIVFGGLALMRIRSYGLAMSGSVLVALPCISPSCCLFIGLPIGLWSMIVLLSEDVQAGYQARARMEG